MRRQNGCIRAHGNCWTVLWREGTPRKLHSKALREITSEDRKNRDRSKKLRTPQDVKDAAAAHMDVVNRAAGRPGQAPTTLTLGELWAEHYLPDNESTWAPATLANFQCLWNRHLKPRIGQSVVRDFRMVDATYLWKAIHKDNPHLCKRSMVSIQAVLRDVFRWAQAHGMYDDANPAVAELPKTLPKSKPTEAYTAAEVNRMLELAINPRLACVIALFFGAGVRRNEGRGLTWEDYERKEDGAVLHIHRQYGRWGYRPLKRESSHADVYLDETVCSYLDAYKATFPEGYTGLLFPGREAGRPMDMISFSDDHLRPLLKAAGIPYKRGWHSFRRGSDTEIAKKLGTEVAADHGRHTVAIAENHYVKFSAQERRAQKIAKAMAAEQKRDENRQAAADVLGNAMSTRVN